MSNNLEFSNPRFRSPLKREVICRGVPVVVEGLADLRSLGCPTGITHSIEQHRAERVVAEEHRARTQLRLAAALDRTSDAALRARCGLAARQIADADEDDPYSLDNDLDENERGQVAAFIKGLRAGRLSKKVVS